MWAHKYVLFGGAAGPGKSYWLRWAAVELLTVWAARDNLRNVKVGLFCEDYPSLKDRQLSKIKREFPEWLGEIKDTKTDGLCFFLHEQFGGGMIALRNLDDPAKYASTEFAAVLVDELTKNNRQTFDDLRFRLRWPGIEHSPFLAASNPGSIGHGWVKKLWLDRDFTGDDSNLDPEEFIFIPARVKENPHQPESYWETLHSLPEQMRKAMEDGNWDVFSGQYFTDWNRSLHVCEPFAIPSHWRKIISGDYGFTNPSALGWWAIAPDDTWYLYRELYETGLTYPALAERVFDMTPLSEQIDYMVFDPAIWGDRDRAGAVPGLTGGERLAKLLSRRDIPLRRANHNRVEGWRACKELMKPVPTPDGGVTSRLQVFATCREFIRTLPGLVHDERHPEDLDTRGEDHHADAFRYAVNTREDIARVENRVAAYVNAVSDIPENGGFHF